MSDYADSNTFSGWGERDGWRDVDQAEHDRDDARHLETLDRRDRDLPYLTNTDPGDECDCELAA